MISENGLILLVMSIDPSINDIPKNPTDRRAWVCYQLRRRGNSLRQIAREEGVCFQAVSNALLLPSSHLERAIAEAIGFTAAQLFPERFDSLGNRLSPTKPAQRNTSRRTRDVQNRGTA